MTTIWTLRPLVNYSGAMDAASGARALRADARRNYDELLAAGRALLREHGADIPFEDVARRAGLGKGTLYRHFATRDHLLAALLGEEFARLSTDAEMRRADDPWVAVCEWLAEYDLLPFGLRGLGARLSRTIGDDASAVAEACGPMKSAFAELMQRAQASGDMRPDVAPTDVLSVVAALPEHLRDHDGHSSYLPVLLAGLRAAPVAQAA
jgi:AcrR family transcriptional regulator